MKHLKLILIFSLLALVHCSSNNASVQDNVAPEPPIETPDETPPVETPPEETPPPEVEPTPQPEPEPTPTPEPTPLADPIIKFSSSALCVEEGTPVTLEWDVKQSAHVYVEQYVVSNEGTMSVTPSKLTEYSLIALKGNERIEQKITVGTYSNTWGYASHSLMEFPAPFPDDAPPPLAISAQGTYLAASDEKVYLGQVGGDANEISPRAGVTNWTAFAFDPVNPDIMYAATTGRVYRSEDGGQTWPQVIPVRTSNVDLDVLFITIPAGDPTQVYLNVGSGVFLLNTETKKLSLLESLNRKIITGVATTAESLYVIANDKLIISANKGKNFTAFNMADTSPVKKITLLGTKLFIQTEKSLSTYDSGIATTIDTPEGVLQDFAPGAGLAVAVDDKVYAQHMGSWELVGDRAEKSHLLAVPEAGSVITLEESRVVMTQRHQEKTENCPSPIVLLMRPDGTPLISRPIIYNMDPAIWQTIANTDNL